MSVLIAVVVVYAILALGLFLFQSHLIYFPERSIAATPANIGLPFEAVFFQTRDGVRIAGWFIPHENASAVMLSCSGNAGNISHRIELIESLHSLSVSLLLFDYRGYGESGGRPGEEGTYRDAEAAWDYLVSERGIDPRHIVVHGQSLGGSIAAWLAREKKPRALVVESTFTSVPDLAAGMYPIFPVRLLARFQYSTIEYLRQVQCPVLIVHSRDDELIPYAHGKKLYAAANEPKRFLEIRGDHNGGYIVSGPLYLKALAEFLREVVSR